MAEPAAGPGNPPTDRDDIGAHIVRCAVQFTVDFAPLGQAGEVYPNECPSCTAYRTVVPRAAVRGR